MKGLIALHQEIIDFSRTYGNEQFAAIVAKPSIYILKGDFPLHQLKTKFMVDSMRMILNVDAQARDVFLRLGVPTFVFGIISSSNAVWA